MKGEKEWSGPNPPPISTSQCEKGLIGSALELLSAGITREDYRRDVATLKELSKTDHKYISP